MGVVTQIFYTIFFITTILAGMKFIYDGILFCKDLRSTFNGILCIAIGALGIVCGVDGLIRCFNTLFLINCLN